MFGKFYTHVIEANNHYTDTFIDAKGRTIRIVFDDGSFIETLYGFGNSAVTKDQEGDTLATPTSWSGIPTGGSETITIAQRKTGDPIIATYDVYNAAGELTDVYQPAATDGDPTDNGANGKPNTYNTSVNPHTTYLYDTAGNEIAQIDAKEQSAYQAWIAAGHTPISFTGDTRFGYDQNGHQVRQTLPDGESESRVYNNLHQLTAHTDFDGNVATYTYAVSGAQAGLLQQVVYVGAGGSGKATQTVTYTHDSLNRQHTVTDASGTTTSIYDVFGNLIESDTPEGTIHYVFDAATQNHIETYTANTDTVYGYDNQGRLTSVTMKELNGSAVLPGSITLSGAVDPALNGLLVLSSDPGGSDTSGSEFIGNQSFAGQVGIQLADGSGVDLYAYGSGYILNVYDIQAFPGDGGDFTLTLNAQFQVVSQDIEDDVYEDVDANSNPVSGYGYGLTVSTARPAGAAGLVTTYTYDRAGNKLTETLPDGEVTTYGYDDLNRLTNLTEVQGSTTVFSQTYVLNHDSTRHSSHEVQLQPGGTVTTDSVWTYDALQRLKIEAVTSTASNESYTDVFTYDLASNRMSQAHTGPGGGASDTTTYVYNGDDELTSQTSSLSGTTTITYDANGSQISSTNGSNVTTYIYNVRNKMVGYSDGNHTAAYVYDDDGDRVRETVDGTNTYYLTDMQNPTGYDQPVEALADLTRTTYILGDHILGQADASGNVTYLLVDGHGSTQQSIDSTGAITATFRYDAFGTALNFAPTSAGTVFLFGGDAIYDPTSGLYFHGDGIRPTNGFLFIQRDTYRGDPNDPITLHKYLYANANSIGNADPTGYSPFSDILISAADNSIEEAQDLALANEAYGIASEVFSDVELAAANTAEVADLIGEGADASMYLERSLTLADLALDGEGGTAVSEAIVNGSITFSGNTASVSVNFLSGEIGNPFGAISALKDASRAQGATEIVLDAISVNPRLFVALTRLFPNYTVEEGVYYTFKILL